MDVSRWQKRMSPSSRRAWIEIPKLMQILSLNSVALLAEGVDRNQFADVLVDLHDGRPPRGGRG